MWQVKLNEMWHVMIADCYSLSIIKDVFSFGDLNTFQYMINFTQYSYYKKSQETKKNDNVHLTSDAKNGMNLYRIYFYFLKVKRGGVTVTMWSVIDRHACGYVSANCRVTETLLVGMSTWEHMISHWHTLLIGLSAVT